MKKSNMKKTELRENNAVFLILRNVGANHDLPATTGRAPSCSRREFGYAKKGRIECFYPPRVALDVMWENRFRSFGYVCVGADIIRPPVIGL